MRPLVADRVHEPCGLEDQQPQLLDPHAGLGNPVLDDALLGQRSPERPPLLSAAAHQLDGAFGAAGGPHAVMNSAGAGGGLRDRNPIALAADQVVDRDTNVAELYLGMTAV